MSGNDASGSSTTQTQSSRIQTNIVKTMLLVSLLYVVTYTPLFAIGTHQYTARRDFLCSHRSPTQGVNPSQTLRGPNPPISKLLFIPFPSPCLP